MAVVDLATVERLALAFVVNAAWQVPVVIGAGALLARATRRGPARLRQQIWSLVLVLAVATPALGALGVGRSWRPARLAGLASILPGADQWEDSPPSAPGPRNDDMVLAPSGTGFASSRLGPAARVSDPAPGFPLPRGSGLAALLLVAIPAAFGGLRLTRSLRRARHLRRTAAAPAPGEQAAALAESLAPAFGLARVRLLVTDEPIAPAAIGMLRPVVLLPRRLLHEASAADLRAVLAHELAHVVRADAARHVFREVVLLPLGFHPIVPWLRRQLVETRELACDEAAARVVGGARAYARSLLDVSSILAGFARPLTLPGVFGAGLLEARMRHLIGNSTSWGRARARLTLVLAAVAIAAFTTAAIPLAIGGSDAPAAAPAPRPAPGVRPAPEPQPAPDAQPASDDRPAPEAEAEPPTPDEDQPAPAPPPAPHPPRTPRVPRAPHAAPAPPAPPAAPGAPAVPAPPAPPAAPSAPTPAAAPVPPVPPALRPTADVMITITSATPGREVEVEGTYVFSPEGSELHHVKQQTPIVIRTTARLLDAIFSATGTDDAIHIEMSSKAGHDSTAKSTATGKTVTLHGEGSNGWRITTL